MYNPSVNKGSLKGHIDAVLDIATYAPQAGSPSVLQLGQDRQQSSSVVTCIPYAEELGLPTSMDFVLRQLVVGYNTAQAVVYDIEMCKTAIKLDCATSYNHTPNTQVNKVHSFPVLSHLNDW